MKRSLQEFYKDIAALRTDSDLLARQRALYDRMIKTEGRKSSPSCHVREHCAAELSAIVGEMAKRSI